MTDECTALPTVATFEAPPLVGAVLKRLSSAWTQGALRIDLPTGGALALGRPENGRDARWKLNSWRAAIRIALQGDLGFAAGFVAGDWDTPDLPALLSAFAENYDGLVARLPGLRALEFVAALAHRRNRNSRAGSRRNILAHYDLGNDFYGLWLDPSMTYSAAAFAYADEPLETAQTRKYARLAKLAGVQPGARVLEIGCGWGGFAEYAARDLQAHVTAVTLSPAQKAFAEARLHRAGLSERVEVRLADYRDLSGAYDAIVSIEMFEAVGEAYWPTYFRQLQNLLAPGAAAALQVITIREDLFDGYRRRPDFIQMEVFPGGMLPTRSALAELAPASGLKLRGPMFSLGADYERTLRIWRQRFEASWPEVSKLGFDERFRRLWTYYLAYCEAGFATGRTDVVQFALQRGT